MPSRRRVVKRIRVRRPTLSDMNAQAMMIAKSGVDVVPKLFTEVIEAPTAAINTFTFTAAKDAKISLNV